MRDFLSLKTEKYAYPCFSWKEDHRGFYFPDAVIAPLIDQAQSITRRTFKAHLEQERQNGDNTTQSPLNRHRLLIPDPQISWKESCALVISAFTEFDPSLGAKAAKVITDNKRWILDEALQGEAAGCCHPANCETNQNPYAVIEYSHDGTINDAVYIAHEIGHLIADDYINEAGFSFEDCQRHMAEVQAFFTQHILYDYLSRHDDTKIKNAVEKHFTGEITRSLYTLPVALGALAAENAFMNDAPEDQLQYTFSTTMQNWLGDDWQEYAKAKRLSDNINDRQKRDDWGICDLHQHPMASIIAAGIFLQTKNAAPAQRTEITNNLLGKEGPKNITDILQNSGIKNAAALHDHAQQSLNFIANAVIAQQNNINPNRTTQDKMPHPTP